MTNVFAQQGIAVSGIVTDETGQPLPGVSVLVKGTSLGTTTEATGNYTLTVPNADATLELSYIGMITQEIIVGNRTIINVIMLENITMMDEVVVIGYGTQRRSDLTGSVVRANLGAIQESPNVSLMSSMQGTTAGLNVNAVTEAGTQPEISIRGRTSVSGTQAPLIVLDGTIYRGDLIDLNPNDIESIDILKDASAAAIYGSQASNGVMLITSKSGARSTKKSTVNYSFSFALQEIAGKDMLPEGAAGYLRKIGDRYLSESRIGDDMLTMNPAWDPAVKFFGPEIAAGHLQGINNNYWDLLTNKHPYIMDHNLSVSGRTDVNSYFFSLGYVDQENVVINDTYKRYNFRVNLEARITNWMKVGIQSFYTIGDRSGVRPSIGQIIQMPPQVPYQDENGELIFQPYRGNTNLFLQYEQDDLNKRYNLFGNIYADIDIPFIKGLNYRMNFSQNLINNQEYRFNPNFENNIGEGYKQNNQRYQYTLDHIVSYRRTFGLHAVSGTFVYGVEESQYEETEARGRSFSNKALGYNRLQVSRPDLQTVSSGGWKESSLYTMLRLGYTYNDRYIFNGTVRRDGFSGFGDNNKFGIFPSIGLGWRISEEKFLQDVDVMNDLKLRFSYGLNGNRTVSRYQTLARITAYSNRGYLYGAGSPGEISQQITSMPNSDLKWETTRSFNLGIDFSLYNYRLFGAVEGYIANTYDMLYDINIPQMNGFGTIATNIGKLNNKGFEVTLTGVPVQTKDFSWDVTFVYSTNRNKVVSILGPDASGKENDIVNSKIFIDHPFGVCYDFNIIGMWQVDDYRAGIIPAGFTYGSYKVEDINNDGRYTAADDRKIIGYYDPLYRFSILNAFKYKDFEFKFFINSVQGGKNHYLGQPGRTLPNPDNTPGWNSFKFDYWTPENPNARYRQLGHYVVALGETFSPYVSRSFIRLQDVTLSYNLPKAILEKIKMNRVKVYFNAKNLFTITDWDGWDPEPGNMSNNTTPPGTGLDVGAYPLLRSYSIGFNIEF
jgi:TonB-linked SusC/RagA family outer membrane protein